MSENYTTAIKIANTALGPKGDRIEIADADYVELNGELVWLGVPAPRGYFAWRSLGKEIDIYVIIYPNKTVDVKTTEPMKYLPEAYFGRNLYRYIWKKYPTYMVSEAVMTLIDGKPKFVVTLSKYKVFNRIKEPQMYLVIDPATGEIEEHTMDEKIPGVLITVPESTAEHWLSQFMYKHGFWNTLFSKKDVLYPSGEITVDKDSNGEKVLRVGPADVWLVKGNDGKYYWYSAMTPSNEMSMSALAFVDAQTGKIYFYQTPGHYSDIAAMQNVMNHPEVSKTTNLQPEMAILITAKDKIGWYVPVLGENRYPFYYTIVDAETGEVFLGKTLEEAMSKWLGGTIQIVKQEQTPQGVLYIIKIIRANGTVEEIPVYVNDTVVIQQKG